MEGGTTPDTSTRGALWEIVQVDEELERLTPELAALGRRVHRLRKRRKALQEKLPLGGQPSLLLDEEE